MQPQSLSKWKASSPIPKLSLNNLDFTLKNQENELPSSNADKKPNLIKSSQKNNKKSTVS